MDAPRLRSLLLRGSVIATANWPVVIAQAIAESVVKALAGIPLAGAALLLLLQSVPNALPATGPGLDGAASALAALATVPAALAGVAVSALVAAVGSIVFGAVIKAGTVTVIVAGEVRARAMAAGPLRIADLTAAHAWSRTRFMAGCARFGPRFVRLALVLAVAEGAIALAYATAVVQAYRGFVSLAASWWLAPVVVGVSGLALAASIAAELVYRLAQLALVMEDRDVAGAVRGAVAFVRRDALVVARLSLAARAAVGDGVRDHADRGRRVRPRVVRAGGRRRRAAAAGGGLGRPRPDAAVHRAGGAGGVRDGVPAGGGTAGGPVGVVGGVAVGVVGGVVAGVVAGVVDVGVVAVGVASTGGAGVGSDPALGGGAGTGTTVPGSDRERRRRRIEGAARGVQHAVLGHEHDDVVEERRPERQQRPCRQRLERDAAGVGRQRQRVERPGWPRSSDRWARTVGREAGDEHAVPGDDRTAGRPERQLLAPGLRAAADLEGPDGLVEHHRDDPILVDGQADGRRPGCGSASAPGPCRRRGRRASGRWWRRRRGRRRPPSPSRRCRAPRARPLRRRGRPGRGARRPCAAA